MFLSSAIITVHLENLRHNLKTLLARHPSLMPVIKADAYGHGVVAVARVLAEEGIQHMAVGSVGEGALLRQEGHTAFLLALMGLARDEDTALAASYDITPLVHSRESLERILAQSHLTGRAKPLTVAIKFDTGMSRLGFRVDEAAELADYLRTLKEVRPVLVMSHLAASDTPALDDFTHEQARRFHEAVVRAILTAAETVRALYDINIVTLSGGVFMNRYLTERALSDLQAAGFTIALNRELPPNDASVSYGQAVIGLHSNEGGQ